MSINSLSFPKYFPHKCPPLDATSEELIIYRYCENSDVVLPTDFISYYQMDPNKYKDNVLAYGLSVMSSKEECIKGLKLPSIKKKFKSFAKGATCKNTGVIKRTPKNNNSHCTWWLYDGVRPELYFLIES